MTVTPDLLTQTRVFSGVTFPAEAAAMWTRVSLATGDTLWAQNEAALQVGVLLSGRLSVRVGDVPVAAIGPGELVGESSAFVRGEVRTAAVIADQPSELVVLGRAHLATLRTAYPELYDALLDRALVELSERVVATDLRIQQLSRGDRDAPAPEGVIASLWRQWTTRTPGSGPDAAAVLRTLPIVNEASEDVILELAPTLLPRFVEKDTAIFLEGDVGDALYVVAAGKIGVVRGSEPGRAHTLATIGPGSLFGTGALLGHGKRMATCVAEVDSWVLCMDRIAFKAQKGEVRRVWREALLSALRGQILGADRALARLEAGAPISAYDEASGHISAHKGG